MPLFGYLRISGPKRADWSFEVERLENNSVDSHNALFQREVEGYFKDVPLANIDGSMFCVLCNEEGLQKGLPPTCAITNQGKVVTVLVGKCMVVRIQPGSRVLSPLLEADIPHIKKFLKPMVL